MAVDYGNLLNSIGRPDSNHAGAGVNHPIYIMSVVGAFYALYVRDP